MSNEVAWDYTSGATLYFCRFQPNGDVFISDGSSDEIWGGGNDADDYDVGLVESGASGHFVGHFDTPANIANGSYRVTIYLQAGANPVDGDVAVAQGIIHWRGFTVNLDTVYSDLVIVDTNVDTINTNIGTPTALDGGSATLGSMLTKMADDNDGADFNAGRDSLNVIRTRGDLAWTTGVGATPTAVYTIDSIVRTVGDNDGGDDGDVNVVDGSYFSTGEVGAGTKLEVDAAFTATAITEDPVSVSIWGYYAGGGGHYQIVQAYNYTDSAYEEIGTIGNGSVVTLYQFAMNPQHINASTGAMAIKILHSAHTGVPTHALHIDKIIVATASISLLDSNVEAILEDTETTIPTQIADDVIGPDSDTLTDLSDQMDVLSAQGSQVTNIYGPGE